MLFLIFFILLSVLLGQVFFFFILCNKIFLVELILKISDVILDLSPFICRKKMFQWILQYLNLIWQSIGLYVEL